MSLLTFLALCATLAGSQQQDTGETTTAASEEAARGLASSYEPEDRPTQRRNSHIYMGIYKNYKSTYLGNKTTSEYRKRLRERVSAAHLANNEAIEEPATEGDEYLVQRQQQEVAIDDALAQELRNEANAEALLEAQTDAPVYDENETAAGKKRRKRKRKNRNNVKKLDEQLPEAETELDEEPNEEADNVERYHVGPGLNVSLDMSNDIVRVKLDGENLKEILAARWLTADNSEEGEFKGNWRL